MRKLPLRRPSAGLALGALALIVSVAVNSSAFADTNVTVRTGQIEKGAITAKTLAVGADHPKALSSRAMTAKRSRPARSGRERSSPTR